MSEPSTNQLVVKKNPFENERVIAVIPSGQKLLHIVDELSGISGIPLENIRVYLDGEHTPQEFWRTATPKTGVRVDVVVTPSGGDSGGIIKVVAAVAIGFVLGPVVGLALAAIPGATAALGVVATALVTKVVAAGLSAVITGALIPPPSPASFGGFSGLGGGFASGPSAAAGSRQSSFTADQAENPALSITGTRNQSNPYGVIPRVYGRHRVFPLLAAQSYSVPEGDEQYLYLLFDFGYGPLELSDLQIGTTPLSNYEDVDMQIHEQFDPGDGTEIYRNDVTVDKYALTASVAGGAVTVTTRANTDEFQVDLYFQSLVKYDKQGKRQSHSVSFTIEYRLAGSSDPWLDMKGPTLEPVAANRSSTAITSTATTNGERFVVYETDKDVYSGGTLSLLVPTTQGGSSINAMKFQVFTRRKGQTDADWRSQGSSTDWVSAGNTETFRIASYGGEQQELKIVQTALAIDTGSWDGANGSGKVSVPNVAYSYDVAAGQVVSGQVTYTNDTAKAFRRAVTIRPGTKNKWECRITRTTQDAPDTFTNDASFVVEVRSITFQSPVNFQEIHTLIEMRIKATDQLNGTLDTFSAIATSKLNSYNGSSWTTTPAITRNPAWIYADLLRGEINPNPIADARIDSTTLASWASACSATAPQQSITGAIANDSQDEMWKCDFIIDGDTTVYRAAQQVAAIGRATFGMNDGKFSVVRDTAQTTPIQIFTPRNSYNFSGVKAFVGEMHALKVRFINPEKEWQWDEIIVYDDGYNADGTDGNATATEFTDLELLGVTTTAQAWREGRYHIANIRLRPERFHFNTDFEHLACTRGDLVYFVHDVPRLGGSPGRVTATTASAGLTETVTFDEVFTMASTVAYTIRGRLPDGTVTNNAVTAVEGEQSTFTLITPVSTTKTVTTGDLMVVGQVSSEVEKLIVQEIRNGADLTAKLTCVAYASAVHSADQGTIPSYSPNQVFDPVISAPLAPIVTSVQIDTGDVNRFIHDVVFSWRPAAGTIPAAYEVYVKNLEGVYNLVDVITEATYTLLDQQGNSDSTIKIVPVSPKGNKLALSDISESSHTVTAATPADVTNFNVNVVGDTSTLSWTVSASSPVVSYEIRYSSVTSGAAWEDMAQLIPSISHPSNTIQTPALIGSYAIKAVSYEGELSENAAIAVSTSAGFVNFNVVETTTQNPTFAGSHASTAVNGSALELTTTTLFDATAGDFDNAPGLFSAGGGNLALDGTYTFTPTVDLTDVYTSRVTPTITFTASSYGSVFDDMSGFFDDLTGLFDAGGLGDGVDVTLEVRTTEDDPSGSPTWTDWIAFVLGDYTARAYQFRAFLEGGTTGFSTPSITVLSASIDMPDRLVSEYDTVSSVGGTSVSFSPAFRARPAIVVDASNLEQGDFWVKSSETASGFTINFYNSVSTSVSRTFDHHAQGYGRVSV